MASGEGGIQALGLGGQADLRRDDQSIARIELITAIANTIATRELSQVQAAKLCGTDQPTLSKVLRGRTASVTLDKLVCWLLALGRSVEVRVGGLDPRQNPKIVVAVDGRSKLD